MSNLYERVLARSALVQLISLSKTDAYICYPVNPSDMEVALDRLNRVDNL